MQTSKLSNLFKQKQTALDKPVSTSYSRNDKLGQISKIDLEILRILRYSRDNSFPDDYRSRVLEEKKLDVPGEITNMERASTMEIIDKDADMSIEVYGVNEETNEIEKLGEVNRSEGLVKKVNKETLKAIGKRVGETIIDFFIGKTLPFEFTVPIIIPEPPKDKEMI